MFQKTKCEGAAIAQRREGGAHEDVEEKELSRWNGDCHNSTSLKQYERSIPCISSGEDSACGWKTRDSICRGKSEGQGQPGQPCSGFSQQQLKLQGRGGSDSQENLSYQSNPLQELSAKGVVPFIQSHSVVLQIYQHFLCISCAYRTYYIYALLLPFHVFLCYEFY